MSTARTTLFDSVDFSMEAEEPEMNESSDQVFISKEQEDYHLEGFTEPSLTTIEAVTTDRSRSETPCPLPLLLHAEGICESRDRGDQDAIPEPSCRATGSGVIRLPEGIPQAKAVPTKTALLEPPVEVTCALEANQATVSELLVDALVEAGVDTFFGIPGGPIGPVFDAVLRNPGARLVESRQETSAVFAAVGYHRASGKVPCIMVTAGPGATNAITGIAHAHLERVPMVIICGDVAWAATGGRLLQNTGPEGIDIERMLAGITRATIRIAQSASAVSQGIAALHAATDPYHPGPALLVLPIHHTRAPMAARRVEISAGRHIVAPPRMSVVEETCRMLADAERPLIVLGAGCRRYGTVIRRLVDALDVPFVTTPQAKGVVSERHPRSLRHGGLAASLWARQYTAAGVDVAVVLGSDLDDCSVGPTPYIKSGGRLVHVDLDPSVFNRNLPAHLAVIADVGQFAKLMYDVVIESGLRNGRGGLLMRDIHAGSPFAEPDFRNDRAEIITPHRAIADLELAASGAAFVTDIGEHMLFALHYLTADGPDRFSIGLSLGSMGSGIAAAVGIALARPERPVVCVCGDGGMQMAGMESLVALQERLPVIYAVFNDARYNMVYHGYRQVFGRTAPWESPWVDFAGWARSMGMAGLRIHHPGQITAELINRLVEARIPAILDIRIDREVRMSGGGRTEALQQMSMLSS